MRNFRTFVNDPAGNDPAATDYLGATNINNFLGEAENMVSRSGQSLSTDDGTSDSNQLQMAESAFLHGVKSQGFVDSGSANTYEITPISGASGVKIPADYANMDGATIWFTPTNASTTDSTVNIGQTSGTLLGAKKLLNNDGSAITTEITTDGPVEIRYDASADSSNGAWLLQPWSSGSSSSPSGYFYGLEMSNNATDSDHDIDVSPGRCKDDTGTDDIVISSTIVKQIDASWSSGSNAGGLDTGSVAVDTWYHLFAIKNPTTGASDVLISASPTSPTMPSGFTLKRRIGSVLTDSSSNVLGFLNFGDDFVLKRPIVDYFATGLSTGSTTVVLSVPSGVRVLSRIYAGVSGDGVTVYPRSIDQNSITLSDFGSGGSYTAGVSISVNATVEGVSSECQVFTDTSSTISVQRFAASGTCVVGITTIGWKEYR